MIIPVIIAFIVLALVAVFVILSKRGLPQDGDEHGGEFNYLTNDSLLTPAERSFYGALKICTGDQLLVFAKVRLADIFHPEKELKGGDWRRAQNKLDRKHVDFLLCRVDNLAPVVVIELDDSSHKRERAQKNDAFKDELFAVSNVALIRVTAKQSYNPNEIAAAVNDAITAKKATLYSQTQ